MANPIESIIALAKKGDRRVLLGGAALVGGVIGLIVFLHSRNARPGAGQSPAGVSGQADQGGGGDSGGGGGGGGGDTLALPDLGSVDTSGLGLPSLPDLGGLSPLDQSLMPSNFGDTNPITFPELPTAAPITGGFSFPSLPAIPGYTGGSFDQGFGAMPALTGGAGSIVGAFQGNAPSQGGSGPVQQGQQIFESLQTHYQNIAQQQQNSQLTQIASQLGAQLQSQAQQRQQIQQSVLDNAATLRQSIANAQQQQQQQTLSNLATLRQSIANAQQQQQQQLLSNYETLRNSLANAQPRGNLESNLAVYNPALAQAFQQSQRAQIGQLTPSNLASYTGPSIYDARQSTLSTLGNQLAPFINPGSVFHPQTESKYGTAPVVSARPTPTLPPESKYGTAPVVSARPTPTLPARFQSPSKYGG